MIRHRYPDEEPDFDEVRGSLDAWFDAVRGTCRWCGHSDHRVAECPNMPHDAKFAKRRTKAQQLAAVRGKKPLDGRT